MKVKNCSARQKIKHNGKQNNTHQMRFTDMEKNRHKSDKHRCLKQNKPVRAGHQKCQTG